jgi:UDP-N-acetylglucosamine 2-epimerase (non-hydrolysing)/UDP-GlcNAc3NAcA epimerase
MAVRILTIVGNRPQFIKAAALSGLLRERHEEVLVHTGQHHADVLSRVFFEELGLADPEYQLGISGGTNSSQTARMLAAIEPVIAEVRPHAVLVYGDTNSTLAGALAGAQWSAPVIHVEAGMRSFERDMPEELNRVLVDHMASLLLCSSDAAAENLRAEGVGGRRQATIAVVGDVMVDVALRWQPAARENGAALDESGLRPGGYLLLTAHRAGNVDPPERLRALVGIARALGAAGSFGPLLFPVHPRTRERLRAAALEAPLAEAPGVLLTDPLPYAAFSALLCQASAVLTDSGGVQKEAYLAGVPCLTLRAQTEWTETVASGWNTLVDLNLDAVMRALERPAPAARPALYGDGQAGRRSVEAIDALLEPGTGALREGRRTEGRRAAEMGPGTAAQETARRSAGSR